MDNIELQVLLHHAVHDGPYMTRGESHERGLPEHWSHLCTDEEVSAHNQLVHLGLLEPAVFNGEYELTEKGLVLYRALLALPLPTQTWVMP